MGFGGTGWGEAETRTSAACKQAQDLFGFSSHSEEAHGRGSTALGMRENPVTLSRIESGLPWPFGERSCESKFSVRSWSWAGPGGGRQEGPGVITWPGGMRHTQVQLGPGWHSCGGSTNTCSRKEVIPPSGLACGFQKRLSDGSAGPALRKPPL